MTTDTKRTEPPTRQELESSLEAYFYNAVRARGGRVDKLIATKRGIPDRLVLLPGGRIYLVELKALGGRTSVLQEVYHARAAELGTTVHVLEGRAAVDAWLRGIFAELDAASEGAEHEARLARKRQAAARRRAAEKLGK